MFIKRNLSPSAKNSQNILIPRIRKWKGPLNNQLFRLFVCIIRNFIYNQKAVIWTFEVVFRLECLIQSLKK